MPQLDLIDESFVVAAPAAVAAALADPRRWRAWWPDLELSVFADRGEAGLRWNVTGALAGSMEVWLEPFGDGAIVHYYLRAEPATGPYRSPHRALAEIRRRQRAAKRIFWALKDELEGDRGAGEPRAGAAGAAAAGEPAAPESAPESAIPESAGGPAAP